MEVTIVSTGSRARRISFYVLMGLTIVLTGVLLWPALSFVGLVWAPDATLNGIFSEAFGEDVTPHRLHGLGMSLVIWTLVIGLVAQLRQLRRKIAPMWQAVMVPVVAIMLEVGTGAFDPSVVVMLALVGSIALLHPSTPLLRIPRIVHKPTIRLTALAAIPLTVFAYGQLRAQLFGLPEDAHVAHGHYVGMAEWAVILIVTACLGATALGGWRISAWTAAAMAGLYGLGSIVFPAHASSVGGGWGLALVLWGAAFVLVAERRARALPADHHPSPVSVGSGGS